MSPVPAEGTIVIAVAVPADPARQDRHAKLVIHLLERNGYKATALTNDQMLQIATTIRSQLQEAHQ